MTYGPPIPYMDGRDLININDLWSPITLYGMQEPCNCQWLLWSPYLIWMQGNLYLSMTVMVPIPYMECRNLLSVNDLWSPIPYMDGRDLITINDLWSPITLYGMWEPSNCQWLYGPPNLIWNVGTLYLSMTVLVPQTLYGNVGTL